MNWQDEIYRNHKGQTGFFKQIDMESVELKVKGKQVKVVHESGVVSHVFDCEDLSVKGLLSQLKREQKEFDLEPVEVLDVVFK